MLYDHHKSNLGGRSERNTEVFLMNSEVIKTENNKIINITVVVNGIRSVASEKALGRDGIPSKT